MGGFVQAPSVAVVDAGEEVEHPLLQQRRGRRVVGRQGFVGEQVLVTWNGGGA